MDGGAFQKFADSYLKKKGYNHLVPMGSVIGSNKVSKGTPDTLIMLANKKYIFVEYTTQQKGLFDKLIGDLNKCFDENKTGIPVVDIKEIVFCHTSVLSTEELNLISKECEKHRVNLNIFNINSISYDLLELYPSLARDYLGINVDTGQIISPEEFVPLYGKNKLTTRLDTRFHFREEELKNIGAAFEKHNLVIILGKPGVGKTRIALESCAQFIKLNPEYKNLCIFNRGPDIFTDMQIHFKEPGAFLILVDDANRMSKFEYMIQLIQHQRKDQKIKIIATVRNYAVKQIRDEAQAYEDWLEINIDPFTDPQIKDLVEKEYGIVNSSYLDRIVSIANGNPRLAIMAAEVAREKNTLESINDVSDLYDRYFASIKKDLSEITNPNLLKAAGIVAFFRVLDRNNKKTINAIKSAFDINHDVLWESINQLHGMEILDIYENEVARVSDQVLATYLFYLAFFKNPVLDFGRLLEAFFPKYRKRFIEAMNPVMSAFDNNMLIEKIQPHLDQFWKIQIRNKDEKCLYEIMDVFGLMKRTDILVYFNDQISMMPEEEVDINNLAFEEKSDNSTPSIFSILRSFQNAEDEVFRIALKLLVSYLEKQPSRLPDFLDLCVKDFGFRNTSYRQGYSVQKDVIDILWQEAQRGKNLLLSRVFIYIAQEFLHTKFTCTESKDNSINFITFELLSGTGLTEIRRSLWDGLFCLYEVKGLENNVLKALQDYSMSGYKVSKCEIIKEDAAEVLPFLAKKLSPLDLKHSLLMQAYLKNLKRCSISFDNRLMKFFESEAYKFYDLLAADPYEMLDSNLSIQGCREHKENEIKKHIASFSLNNYKQLLCHCAKIKTLVADSHKAYHFQENMVVVFDVLAKTNPSLYPEVVKQYLV